MGTNYYLYTQGKCRVCGHRPEPIHIGKSSAGWCFALHVMPGQGINDLDDWIRLWSKPDSVIENEYGELILPAAMEVSVAGRSRDRDWGGRWWEHGCSHSEAEFHARNHSQRGPNGLLRHIIGNESRCVKHGSGTWDCVTGDFS